MWSDPAFVAVALAAVAIAGLSKGGFAGIGVLSTPLLALVIPPVQAAAIMLPILIVQDAYSVSAFRRSIDWRNIAILTPGALIGIVTGYLIAEHLSQAVFELALGLISIAFAARSLLKPTPVEDVKPGGIPAGLAWGSVSGLTSMIAHAGAPPFQIYVMPQRLPRDVLIGTGIVYFTIVNWLKVPFYLSLGQLTKESITNSIVLMPVAIFATWASIRLVRMIDGERFYTIAYLLLVAVGAKLAYDGVTGLI